MTDLNLIGEPVREKYRRQGEERLREQILEDLLHDTIVAHDLPVYLLERIQAIVKGEQA